jgi:hypothetical protein
MKTNNKWLPIETAPKDGTLFLALKDGEYREGKSYIPAIVRWSSTHEKFIESDEDAREDNIMRVMEWKLDFWQPIDSAPNGLPYGNV